jgi:hypothetical protein
MCAQLGLHFSLQLREDNPPAQPPATDW